MGKAIANLSSPLWPPSLLMESPEGPTFPPWALAHADPWLDHKSLPPSSVSAEQLLLSSCGFPDPSHHPGLIVWDQEEVSWEQATSGEGKLSLQAVRILRPGPSLGPSVTSTMPGGASQGLV